MGVELEYFVGQCIDWVYVDDVVGQFGGQWFVVVGVDLQVFIVVYVIQFIGIGNVGGEVDVVCVLDVVGYFGGDQWVYVFVWYYVFVFVEVVY